MHKPPVLLFMAALTVCSCKQQMQPGSAPTFQPPSAAEIFDLRTKCAQLGEKIKEENIVGPALTQDAISRYNPETNRCYVVLEVSTADLSTPREKYTRSQYLYDGQTKEMLAFVDAKGENYRAMVFTDSLKKYVHNPTLPDFNEVQALIDKFIAEDRRP